MAQMKLDDAIEQFIDYRLVTCGLSKSTVKADRWTLQRLRRQVGNIYVHNITEEHIRAWVREKQDLSAGAYNHYINRTNKFFEFCRGRGYVPKHHDVMRELQKKKVIRRESDRVPVEQFGDLLDACDRHPRDRAIVACGLYLFLRQSEVKSLKVGDLNLAEAKLRVVVHKSKLTDHMPISEELDHELRTWLTFYAQEVGQPLDPEWPLFPGLSANTRYFNEGVGKPFNIVTHRLAGRYETIAQAALEGIGFETRNADGTSKNEGFHTLRRSGARAYFDVLCEASYDGALRIVQAMLHHANSETTEIYLGLALDKHKRDTLLTGRAMFPGSRQPANVVPFRKVSHG